MYMSFLELKNISFSVGKNNILNNINLNIDKSCFFSILGPSGAGKTTILRIITGALSAGEGQVILDGEIINRMPMEKRQIAMVHQSKQLFPHLTVLENIQFGMKMKKLGKDKIIEKTEEITEFFNMKTHLCKYPHQLSGGQQQLVALMRALATEPKVLLLDEPFTGLDNNLRNYIRDYILKVHRQFKITTVMITHDKEDAFFMSDKIAFLFNGEAVLCAEPAKLVDGTNIEEVNSFLGEITSLGDGSIVFSDKILRL
ncbi:MAG TPA: hypothetical protein DC038_07195 [Clostridiales bacterium]|nr:hypothetical protein [Clostridiales bacterium]